MLIIRKHWRPLAKKVRHATTSSPHLPPVTPSTAKNNTFVEPVYRNRAVLADNTANLLQKLGFVKQSGAGIVHYLPYGLRVMRRLSHVIRGRMEQIGFAELELACLSNAEAWQQTGRWDNNELFKLKDSKGAQLCLAPTCEEDVVTLVSTIQSYKQMPVKVYQISKKFRDEKRPRAGLLRGREFLMKDAYSFDINEYHASRTYDDVNGAYAKIFADLKIPVVPAAADSGSIGGNKSTEWHYLHVTGEDTVLRCGECGAASNIETAASLPLATEPPAKEARAAYYATRDALTLVAVYFPADRTLLPRHLQQLVPDIDFSKSIEDFVDANDEEDHVKQIIRVIDPRVTSSTALPDFPSNVPFQRNSFVTFNDVSVVEAREGELCAECEKGVLTSHPAIEVGHTFYLGTRYSEPLDGRFMDADGSKKLFDMGCYGIGVSRLLAAIAEILRDGKGLCFPAKIAPYDCSVVLGKNRFEEHISIQKMLCEFRDRGIEARVDPRTPLSLPERISASHSVGIPLCIVAGKNYPELEIEVRGRPFEGSKWEEVYAEQGQQWGWRMEVDKYGNEKHYVGVEKVADVVKVLLEDL